MGGRNMEMTKEALKLFIQSLPQGSMFEIVSFGTDFSVSSEDCRGFHNTDQNVNLIKEQISEMSADMGGTNIYSPLEFVINSFLIDFDKKPP